MRATNGRREPQSYTYTKLRAGGWNASLLRRNNLAQRTVRYNVFRNLLPCGEDGTQVVPNNLGRLCSINTVPETLRLCLHAVALGTDVNCERNLELALSNRSDCTDSLAWAGRSGEGGFDWYRERGLLTQSAILHFGLILRELVVIKDRDSRWRLR